MPDIDVRPAAAQMAGLLALVPDDGLDAPTPCEGLTLGQLIGHVIGFAEVFTLSARKDLGPMTATPPQPGDADLAPGWQQRAAEHLTEGLDAPPEACAAEGAHDLQAERARSILRLTRRLVAMVDDLYQASRYDDARAELRVEPVRPASLLTELPDHIGAARDRERIIIAVPPHAEAFPLVYVNAPKMERALANLVANALKYSLASTKVTVELHRTESQVVYSVHDQGPGIASEDLPLSQKHLERASRGEYVSMGRQLSGATK